MQIQSQKPIRPNPRPLPSPAGPKQDDLKPDTFQGRVEAGLQRAFRNGQAAFLGAAAIGSMSGVVLSIARDTMEGPGLTMFAGMGLSPILAIPVAAALGATLGAVTRDAKPDSKASLAIGAASGLLVGCALTGVI